MYVVVGLGNPGRRYAATRHNVGFMVIERLAERWGVALAVTGGARIGRGDYAGETVMLVQPQRYMNLSGEALVEAVPGVKLRDGEALPDQPPSGQTAPAVVVVHDDLDIPCGQLRVKRGGGSGGHRGVASLAAQCGPDFFRVRVGVGRPNAGEDAAAYVLAPWTPEQQTAMAAAIDRAGEAVEGLIDDGLDVTMNRFNQRASATARGN